MTNINRKIDRRTLYTVQIVKDSILKLVEENGYSKITVAKLCRRADITRTTFYLHFDNITAVLNEVLEDALDFQLVSENGPFNDESFIPACQRVAKSSKYQALFMDSNLTEYIIGRIYSHEKDRMIPDNMKKTNLNQKDADLMFQYTLRGSFYVNYQHHWQRTADWKHDVKLMNYFVESGYKAFHER
ncbi:TetR/AcrR family transcriptional regulator [Companilactobacillus heilongjiangensis]|uniref:Transcriptional regulator n=1 Tax=Companilactobacillus heilongjiangensis TaxID=1074467 RepID=A0A0K2LCE3_9LACO|nr:TetR/AcrR family transcriptional regulator [Companilactobacillus heilongjiangensis]ALB28972.1 transcriptional regulator [Companilactobacillus heilongjiangensis]